MDPEGTSSDSGLRLTPDRRSQLDATRRAFASARTLPSWVFTEPAVFELELGRLLGRSWLCAGHRSGFQPGQVRRLDLGRHSVLLSCDADNRLHAFRNVCRHRGTRLQHEQVRKCQLMVCPYHGWSFDLDGSLRAAPGMDRSAGFCRKDHSLVPVQLETWQGLVFVRLEASGTPLEEALQDFPAPAVDIASLGIAATHRYEVDANWKLLCENYNECYHCAGSHPRLHQLTEPAPDVSQQVRGAGFTGGPMMLRRGHNTMSESGQTGRQPLPGWPAGELDLVHYYHLFPNLFLSLVPDYVMVHLLTPVSVNRVTVETQWLFPQAELAAPGFEPSEVVSFWHETNRQDWALCESAQLGHADGVFSGGLYHPSEQCVHDFDRWYASWLGSAR